jgi:hypothetical protein
VSLARQNDAGLLELQITVANQSLSPIENLSADIDDEKVQKGWCRLLAIALDVQLCYYSSDESKLPPAPFVVLPGNAT